MSPSNSHHRRRQRAEPSPPVPSDTAIDAVAGRGFRAPWLFGATARKSSLTLFDQAVVSGASFVTTMVIGRVCGPAELGIYSLGFTLVLVAPVRCSRRWCWCPIRLPVNRSRRAHHRHYAGAAMVQAAVICAVSVAVTIFWDGMIALGVGPAPLSVVLWTLAAVLPALMFRDFARRFAFAHFQPSRALAVDAAVAAIQLGGIVALAVAGALSAARAFLVIGIGCSVGVLGWAVVSRGAFRLRRRTWPAAVSRNWRFGRWGGWPANWWRTSTPT